MPRRDVILEQRVPLLTRRRAVVAFTVAIATDLVQLLLGPVGWAGADEVLDVVAMAIEWRLLGFHVFLLPTFVLKFLPVTDLLPTWTACVALVVAIRKKEQGSGPLPRDGDIIDV